MAYFAYGQGWLRGQQQVADAMKPRLTVTKKQEHEIRQKISALQNKRAGLYADDTIDDDELKAMCDTIQTEIFQLIESMYETKEQVKNRMKR